jgi:hypothetical protein
VPSVTDLGRSPVDAHHLRFAQPRAMSLKVSDEFTVPLCRTHHRDNHSFGDEIAWWERRAINPIAIALDFHPAHRMSFKQGRHNWKAPASSKGLFVERSNDIVSTHGTNTKAKRCL